MNMNKKINMKMNLNMDTNTAGTGIEAWPGTWMWT
jgi:hypothetical protein